MKTYKDLMVWQKDFNLAIKILELVDSFPKTQKANIISSQLVRAVTSIGANIAEGYVRKQGKEMEQFFQYAIGSVNETDHWLNVCKNIDFIDNENYDNHANTCLEIVKMLGNG